MTFESCLLVFVCVYVRVIHKQKRRKSEAVVVTFFIHSRISAKLKKNENKDDERVRESERERERAREREQRESAKNQSKIIMAASASALKTFRSKLLPIEKYSFLRHLQSAEPLTLYRVLAANAMECLPFVYTPTVGEACEKYHVLPATKTSFGLFINKGDVGKVGAKLRKFIEEKDKEDVKVAVVTDGERILGLGDLGANGMGICEGKSMLYTVFGGVDPRKVMSVCIDVGTENEALRAHEEYRGLRENRIRGEMYDELVDEFMREMRMQKPSCLIQFEDFGNANAFRVLENHRRVQPCFNDDIQGTACVTLAALEAALREQKKALKDITVLFYGAGEAGVGIGELVVRALEKSGGLSHEEAKRRCFFMDSKGLVVKSRLHELQPHKIPFAHEYEPVKDLKSAITKLKPTALIGVSTIHNAFDKEVIETMSALNERPIIFPLSNPTSKAECTFEDAMKYSNDKVIFASGSPFPSVVRREDGVEIFPAQANNAYVFPAVGLASVVADCKEITDDHFLVAAETLASLASNDDIDRGYLFPDFTEIEDVTAKIAANVIEKMTKDGTGRMTQEELSEAKRDGFESFTRKRMWKPPPEVSHARL